MDERQLTELLSVYRYSRPMPALPARHGSRGWWLAAAAVVGVISILILWPRSQTGWQISTGHARRPLRSGEVIAAGEGGATLEARAVGVVHLASGGVLRFEGGNRLALDRGTIHAKTISPPGVFVVDTPRARAIDLGCEYVLTIGTRGAGLLRVSAGWVQLQHEWQQTLVPQGAKAVIGGDGAITPPIFEDAAPAFQNAVIAGNVDTILALARRRDALTLLNLFPRVRADERVRIYDRLNALVPAPPGLTRDAVRDWTVGTTDPWWPSVLRASGVSAIRKKKGMLRGL